MAPRKSVRGKKSQSKKKSTTPSSAKAKAPVSAKAKDNPKSKPLAKTKTEPKLKSSAEAQVEPTSKARPRAQPQNSRSVPIKKTFLQRAAAETLGHLIVAIGGSAGSVEPLRVLLQSFAELPENELEILKRASFILIQHLDNIGDRAAHEVLLRQSPIPVLDIEDGMAIEAGNLYRSTSHSRISLQDGRFHSEAIEGKIASVSAIDYFMRSMSEGPCRHAVAVILSGEGTDGSQGLRAISDAGGMTIVQKIESATFPSMPESAIATGTADHALEPREISERIVEYFRFLIDLSLDLHAQKLRDQTISALSEICEILHKATRHDFKHYKTSTLVRRIERRMQVLQFYTVENYVDKLRSDAKEIDSLFKELLINVTSFFRDPQAFESLKTDVFEKALIHRKHDQKYRVWVAGCSTGEEVYSVAILIREVLAGLDNPCEVQIIATDIDEVALNQARKGSYPATIVETVSPMRLKRYFERKNGRFNVTRELREMVLFSSHNLINDPPFSQLDLITCRNVLIYLGGHLQKKLIPVFHYALRKGGYLFLGNSESLATHKELFRTVSAKYRIAQRKATSIRPPGFSAPLPHAYVSHTAESQHAHEVDVHLVSQRIILDEFAPKYAVVNDDCQIVSVSAGIAQYMDPSEGTFQNNLLRLVKPSLRVGLRSAFSEAKRKKRKVTHQDSSLKIDEEFVRIGITVQPMPQLGDEVGLYMVIIHYFGVLRTKDAHDGAILASASGGGDAAVVEQLERELFTLRSDLDRSVEDLEASNEELKSSNEELLSMNEELQSANEELETSKEEVQTVNEILQKSNTDLENLLSSTEIATLFLDEAGNITSFTPQLTAIYNVTAVDIGRPISHLTSLAKRMPSIPSIAGFGAGTQIVENDIELSNGRWMLRRVLPYRTAEGTNSGIVVTFIDVTHLRVAEERYRQLADSMPQMVWTTDPSGKFDYFNERWYAYTGFNRIVSVVDDAMVDEFAQVIHPEERSMVQSKWLEHVASGERFEYEFRMRNATAGDYRWFLARAVPTRNAAGLVTKSYGSSIDIHDRVLGEQKRRESERRFQIMADTAPVLIWMTGVDGTANWFNRGWLAWTGATLESEIGNGWTDHIHPDDLPRIREIFQRSETSRKPFQYDYRLRTSAGEYRWVSDRGTPRFTPDGTYEGYIGGCTDIHEQKLATERLRASEMRLDLMIRTSPSFMATLRASDLVCEQANDQFIHFVGGRSVLMKPVLEALPELAGQEFMQKLEEVRSSQRAFVGTEVPVRIARRIGQPAELRYIDFTYQPVADPTGAAGRIFVHGTDVTEKVQARSVIVDAKESIERERMNFRNLFQQTPEMVVILSGPLHTFEFVNEAHVKVLGFDATGMDVRTAQPESVEIHGVLDTVYQTGVTAELHEIPITVGLKLRHFNLTYSARRAADGTIDGVMILGVEITEQIESRVELQKARDEAEEARTLAELANESKTRFLANMSHEIRTPLAAILGFSELLRGRTLNGDQDAAEQLIRISRNASQLGRLIDELLDLSKIEAEKLDLERADFSLLTAVEDALSTVSLRAREKGLIFEQRAVGAVPSVINTDPTRFRQVLTNIIGNAVKFTERGQINVEFEHFKERAVSFLRVRVRDTGIGLSREQQARIFEPFMQADTSVTRKYGGTGLGLVLSKRLAKLMGGDLVLEESELDQGSSFVVTIEIGHSPESHAPLMTIPGGAPLKLEAPASLEGFKILVVDDSTDNQTIISLYLRAVKASVEIAHNGQEACEKMAQKSYDLVLMDIQMPVLDGYRALKKATHDGYRGPIVALTAHALKEEKERCLAAGFTDYLSKPIDRTKLINRIFEIVSMKNAN